MNKSKETDNSNESLEKSAEVYEITDSRLRN
jgi:hypothetical protein